MLTAKEAFEKSLARAEDLKRKELPGQIRYVDERIAKAIELGSFNVVLMIEAYPEVYNRLINMGYKVTNLADALEISWAHLTKVKENE
jgi:hypothetical protein